MVSGSILTCNRLSLSTPFQPSLFPSESPHCRIPFYPQSHFHTAGSPLPQYSQPLQPKLSGSNIDTWQICSLSWIDSTLNAQQIFNVGDLSHKHCKAQATPLKLSHLGQDESRYTVTYLGGCPLSHILTLCTPDRIIWSENQRKPWIAIVWIVQTKNMPALGGIHNPPDENNHSSRGSNSIITGKTQMISKCFSKSPK